MTDTSHHAWLGLSFLNKGTSCVEGRGDVHMILCQLSHHFKGLAPKHSSIRDPEDLSAGIQVPSQLEPTPAGACLP